MARTAKVTNITNPAAPARKPGRPAKTAAKASAKAGGAAATPKRAPVGSAAVSPAQTATKTLATVSKVAAAPKRVPVTADPLPKPSKDELRLQVEKLEGTVASLRTKNREANRNAKTATARIAELEDEVAQLAKKLTSQTASPAQTTTAVQPNRGKRKSRDLDPGDAVPPGVAVQEPAPLDEEAKTAQANPEEHLEGE
jgi:hypothetical protein